MSSCLSRDEEMDGKRNL